jgi:hypothetical protein
VAPFAPETREIVLDEHAVAFRHPFALLELGAGFGNHSDVLVTHDDGSGDARLPVHLHVGSADAGDLNLEQSCVLRHVRHGEVTKLGLRWSCPHRCGHLPSHQVLLVMFAR